MADFEDDDTTLDDMEDVLEDMDLDQALDGVIAAPEFVDPVAGIYYLRLAQFEQRTLMQEKRPVHMVSAVYQVVGVQDAGNPELDATVGGLFNENWRLGGSGIKDGEKMNAAEIIKMNKEQFLSRFKALEAGEATEGTMAERMAQLCDRYDTDRFLKVAIKPKTSEEYVNIGKFKVISGDVTLDGVPGEFDADAFNFWYPKSRR